MKIRLREPAGQRTLLLQDTATIGELHACIVEKTSLPNYDLKYGYPPRPFHLGDYDSGDKLVHIGIKLDGEQLIVSRSQNGSSETTNGKAQTPALAATTSTNSQLSTNIGKSAQDPPPTEFSFSGVGIPPPAPSRSITPNPSSGQPLSLSRKESKMSSEDAPEVLMPAYGSTMVLRIMPDDNSCLFRAFNTAFLGSSMDNMLELRSIIAQYIQTHTETYSEAVLDKKVDDYCAWIQTDNAWGGSIELDILSKHFEVEICSIDVQTLRTDTYNEGKSQRVILVYSGIHYDTIAMSPEGAAASPEFDTKIFDFQDSIILETAVQLCQRLQQQHYYTDTAAFSVRCNTCGALMQGEHGATDHAVETGHTDFGEA